MYEDEINEENEYKIKYYLDCYIKFNNNVVEK